MKWRKILAIAVLITYNSWVWAPLLNPNPQALLGYLSELAASNQSFYWFFRAGDVATALLITSIAWFGWRAWRDWLGKAYILLVASLLVAATSTVADVIFALDCTPSFDTVCRAAELADPYEMPSFGHGIASGMASLSVMISFVAVLIGCWLKGHRRQFWLVAIWTAVVGATMVGTVAVATWVGIGHGLIQIVAVIGMSAWFAWLSIQPEATVKSPPDPMPPAGQAEADRQQVA